MKQVYFKGTEIQAKEWDFNVVVGYHKILDIHINFNSSRIITDVTNEPTTDYQKFSPQNKALVRAMFQNDLVYYESDGK